MAEVLITLGIIGIVAAMTLPALLGKYKEVVMINKLKRAYSELIAAMDMTRAKMGLTSYEELFPTDMSAAEQFDGFIQNLQLIERCSASNTKGCGGVYHVKFKRRTNDGKGNIAKGQLVGTSERAVLADGTLVWFGKRNNSGGCMHTYTTYKKDENGNDILDDNDEPIIVTHQAEQCAEIFFDLDGPKGQNQFGYDSYSFHIKRNKADQHTGYGSIYDTIHTGKLDYDKYTPGEKF